VTADTDPCAAYAYKPFLPLQGADVAKIRCFYHSPAVAPLNQVQYLYGVSSDTKSLSADLVAALTPGGVRLALGTAVSSGKAEKVSDDAAQRLKAGGDASVSAQYAVVALSRGAFTFYAFGDGKVNFTIQNFGDTTITEGANTWAHVGVDAYAGIRLFTFDGSDTSPNGGSIFAEYRPAYQLLGSAFAAKLGLPDTQRFWMQQVAIGINFTPIARVMAQRFVGPPEALGATPEALKQWHIAVQISPR
jgi:hypothetical protein